MSRLEKFKEFMRKVIREIEETRAQLPNQYDLEMKVFDQTHNITEKPDNDDELV